jgi:hypothetical protein
MEQRGWLWFLAKIIAGGEPLDADVRIALAGLTA